MLGIGILTWRGLGVPEALLPAPPPFLPLPKGLVMEMEGLASWKAYSLNGSIMEELGTVYGETELEAIEAAENLARTNGLFTAIKVVRE